MVRSFAADGWRAIGHACIGAGMVTLLASLMHSDAAAVSLVAAALGVGLVTGITGRALASNGLGVLAMLILTAATVAFIGYHTGTPGPAPAGALGFAVTRWSWLGFGAAAAWAVAGLTARGERAETWRAFGVCAVGLAFVLAAVSLIHRSAEPFPVTAAAMTIALACAAAGRAMRSPALIALAGVMLLVAAAPLFSLIWRSDEPRLAEALGLIVTKWTILGAVAAVFWTILGLLARRKDAPAQHFAAAPIAVGLLVLYAALHHPAARPGSVTIAWTILALIPALLDRRAPGLRLRDIAAGALTITAAYWAVRFPIAGWTTTARAAAMLLHPGLWSAIALAAALAFIARSTPAPRVMRALPAALATALIFTATTFEAARTAALLSSDGTARLAAVSIWWGLFAVGMIAVGFARRLPAVRHTGLALVMIALGKTVLIDLAELAATWRIAAFIGLGLLMLAIAVAYAKLAAGARTPEPEAPPTAA